MNKDIIENNLFSNHFLKERIQDLEEWNTSVEEKYDELKEIYDARKSVLSEDLNEDQTQQHFINPVLQALGHKWVPEARTKVGSTKRGTILNPDYTFMDMETQMEVHEDEEKSYFDANYAVGDAKAWNRTLDKSTQDHTNPAFQIYNYVDRLRSDWGILTNGNKWRLYSYEKCAADIYFEIDLEKLLQGEKTEEKLETFKYFYLFFRADSFDKEGQSFLEKVYRQSVEYNEGLEDSLEEKVYDGLEVAVKGFFDTNDLEKTEENIELVHRSSLIFLYRTLFILNAESRDLLPTDDKAYRQAFGLTQLKRMIIEEEDDALFGETTIAWDNRLSRLFEGIDGGYDLHESEIPAYNGGLFDPENGPENQFLAENKLYGTYIKQILKLLATNYDEEKQQRVILDYKDLNIRHLGSVYEGLLEHEFRPADEKLVLEKGEWTPLKDSKKDWADFDEDKRVEENELYLTNESGERKATGSYYTPEYIVEYIVENTVGPKVEEKIEEAEENGENILPKILELNVCDPAMGSGHFLTEATGFIAEHIVKHCDLKKQEIDENEDELNWAKRQVVQNCIYGVDINPLAVELGKLSLWIETMAEGKPLNFLDHHLKHGNSLIGSDFDEIFSHPTEDQKRLDSDRYQFGDPQEIKENFQEQYLEIEQMPENTVEQIHEKEQAYKQFIQENILYQQFQQLSNLHTRQYFEKEANSSDYESFLINIGNPGNPFEDTEWYKNAQKDAQNRNYFHWQLEFPKVFFGEQKGFDAVVGNPPYIRVQNLNTDFKNYLKDIYSTPKGKFDIYIPFLEHSIDLTGKDSLVSFIMPSKFKSTQYGSEIKKYIYENGSLDSYLDFSDYQVFPGVTTYTCIPTVRKGGEADSFDYAKLEEDAEERINSIDYRKSVKESFLSKADRFLLKGEYEVKEKLSGKEKTLDEISERIFTGIQTSVDDYFVLTEEEIEDIGLEYEFLEKFAMGQDVRRWGVKYQNLYVIYPEKVEDGEVLPVTKNDLKDNSPNLWSYLNSDEVKEACKGRDYLMDKVDSGDRTWYEVWMRRNPEWFRENKILTPALSSQSNFVVDTEEFYFTSGSAGVYSIMLEDEFNSEENLYLVTALLNSKPLDWYIQTSSPIYRGSYYKYNTQYLEDVPIKIPEEKQQLIRKSKKAHKLRKQYRQEYQNFFEWIESEWGVDIEDLSLKTSLKEYWEYDFDEFMRVAKKNKSQIDGSVKSREFRELMKEEWESSMDTLRPLMQEIDELENEIDAIVFDLYDLTEEEVETVLDSLDTGEKEKKNILEEFRKF